MAITNIISSISAKLKEPSTEKALWILEAITKKSRSEILTDKNFSLTLQEQESLEKLIDKHINEHCPLQYLIGNVPFLDFTIVVEPPILIPRPETEHWCYELIKKLKLLKNKEIKILDLGTGTGCIAISLAKHFKEATIFATDISDKALKLAKQNIELNKIKNIELIKSDLFEKLNNYKFDLIVSNPPYIDEELFETLDLSVKNWEDPQALITKDKGLYIIKRIIDESKKYLNINNEFKLKGIPQIVLEIDHNQGHEVILYLKKKGFSNIQLQKDLFGQCRIISAGR